MEATKEMKDAFYIFYLENEVNNLQKETQKQYQFIHKLINDKATLEEISYFCNTGEVLEEDKLNEK